MGGEGEGGGVDDRQGLQAGVCGPSHQRQVCGWGPGEEGRGVTLLSTWLVHTFHPLCRPVPIPTPGIQLTTLTHVEDVASMLAAVPGNKNAIGQVTEGMGRERDGQRLDTTPPAEASPTGRPPSHPSFPPSSSRSARTCARRINLSCPPAYPPNHAPPSSLPQHYNVCSDRAITFTFLVPPPPPPQ